MSKCYCGTSKTFEECCKPYLEENILPPTAEKLMRSRFSAYFTGNIDYIKKTTHPKSFDSYNFEDLEKWGNENQWEKLVIISCTLGGKNHSQGQVEFKAQFTAPDNKQYIHHELSNFIKEDNKWFYSYGTINPKEESEVNKTGRNDPCPCGSGKKFKKCCA